MACLSSRQARSHKILRAYLRHHTARLKHQIRLKNKAMHMLWCAGYTEEEQRLAHPPAQLPFASFHLTLTPESDSNSSLSSSVGSDSDDTDTSVTSSNNSWSDLLGSDWRESGESAESSDGSESVFTSDSDSGDADDEMPELLPIGYSDLDEEDESSSAETSSTESGSEWDSGDAAEWGWDMAPDAGSEQDMPRSDTLRLDLFQEELRISTYTFDQVASALSEDPVFTNDSPNGQMAIEHQLTITLFRFGHSGNAVGLQKVANWAGVGKGTVTLTTRRMMTAILCPGFMEQAVHAPTAPEKEKAKAWVEAHSCKAWRNGWCLVYGTLVPLFE
ncbi:hypothetical protein B0H10DRAFT_2214712 [Mycena sp. CBHHK59/15]|nr:hypothetical protein B0H10DRAFT_2214712 [Mycena sp. CBHHK59/15]